MTEGGRDVEQAAEAVQQFLGALLGGDGESEQEEPATPAP